MQESVHFSLATEDFRDYPPFHCLIAPYKLVAKKYFSNVSHTQKQHLLAQDLGRDDWQEFSYFIKSCHETLQCCDLTSDEWSFVLDAVNGVAVYATEFKNQLLNFLQFHLSDDFREKISRKSELECAAILIKALYLWDRILGPTNTPLKFHGFSSEFKDLRTLRLFLSAGYSLSQLRGTEPEDYPS